MMATMGRNNVAPNVETTKVGIREFRAEMAEYIASSYPVAITRHGHTVGYFIPTQGQTDADLAALKKVSNALDRLLAAQGVDVNFAVYGKRVCLLKMPSQGHNSFYCSKTKNP